MALLAQLQRTLAMAEVPSPEDAEPLRRLAFTALGTSCEIKYTLADDRRARAFGSAARAWVERFEGRYSRFREDSLLSRINRGAGDWVAIDDEMGQMLDLSGSIHFMSQGCLDVTALPLMRIWNYKAAVPRVPAATEIEEARRLVGWQKVEREPGRVRLPERGMALDFGGWGKEFAVDMAARIARDHGIARALIDFGHDIAAVGAAPGKPAWHIGLEDPARPGEACWGSIGLRDRAVASSGDYRRCFELEGRRFGHIIDPTTGMPVANGCRQVNVIAPTCLQAGVLSTTAFILGPQRGLRAIQETMGVDGCIVTDHSRHQTRGFFNHVVTA